MLKGVGMSYKKTALIGTIQKFSTEDGDGIRSTVFFKGCPLKCKWCHNPELIEIRNQIIVNPSKCIKCYECIKICPDSAIYENREELAVDWSLCSNCYACTEVCYANAIMPVAKEMTVREIMEIIEQDKVFYENTGGGVTLSGGEVFIHHEFAEELIKACALENIKVCLDTSGFAQYEVISKLCSYENVTDILYDIKHINDKQHKQYTGVSNNLIILNLKKLSAVPEIRKKIWLRMPLISSVNDDDINIMQARALFVECGLKKLSLICYHELGNTKATHIGADYIKFRPPDRERLYKIKNCFEEVEIEIEIIGENWSS